MQKPLYLKHIVAGVCALTLFANGTALWACTRCRPQVESGVYNGDFIATLFVLLLPLAVLLVIGLGLYFSDAILAKLHSPQGDEK